MPEVTVPPSFSWSDPAFQELFFRNPLPMWLFDKASLQFVEVNPAAERLYGWSRDEFLAMTLADIRPPEDLPRLLDVVRRPAGAPDADARHSVGWRHLRKDGSLMWVDVYSHDFQVGERLLRLAVAHDVSGLKEVMERLELQSAYFSQLFHNSPEAILLLDDQDRVMDANHAFERLFLYRLEEITGHAVNQLIVPPEYLAEATQLSRSVLTRSSIERDTVRMRRDGTRVEVTTLGYPITVGDRQVGVFVIYRDIGDAKRAASQLAFHATHDPLTGLLNRHEFERRARERLEQGAGGSMIYLDLDQFKVINDVCGHVAGDHLLIEVAERLRLQLADNDTVARLGGDQFGVLLPLELERAAEVAQRLLEAMRVFRFPWQGRQHAITASIGVAGIGGDIVTLSELFAAADTACLTAKVLGRNRVRMSRADDEDLLRVRGELSWTSRIVEALEGDHLTLYFQRMLPVCAEEAATRYEILLRLTPPDGGVLLPGAFVSAAERYGLMPAVDRYVIGRVFRELARRLSLQPQLDDLVTVNLSGTTLGEDGLADYIRQQFRETGLAPGRICFEITETAAIGNIKQALNFIADMRALGCGIALDDFGSGMSSFGYLKLLNIDYLKIDGSFIRDMLNNPLDAATVEAINKVAQVKGLKTVAECVEDEATLMRLREVGVDYVQGFHLHEPEPWQSG